MGERMKRTLNGTWSCFSKSIQEPILGKVPGSVYHDLMNSGKMDDPFFRDNEEDSRERMRQDYTYERMFEIDEIFFKEKPELVCEGIDTLSTIFINDKKVGETANMHRSYRFSIHEALVVGENVIRIVLHSPIAYCEKKADECKHELYQSRDGMRGYSHLRKGHSMFGWDWGPQLPDAGIWKDIYLESTPYGRILHTFQNQIHDKNGVRLKLRTYIEVKDPSTKLEIALFDPDGTLLKKEEVETSSLVSASIEISNPKLWWIVGLGSQPLYRLEIDLIKDGQIVDAMVRNIGLRTIEIDRTKDAYGESFTFVVNKIPVFLRGANYIPEDNLLPRVTVESTKALLDACIEANHNAIRVWGGGYYPSNSFFDLCDERGILVWQDLMFACSFYNLEDADLLQEMIDEVEENVIRIHHHASLGLICGNNENEVAAVEWNIPSIEFSRKTYEYQYEKLFPTLINDLQLDLFYWPSSPSSGGGFVRPNADSHGDMHYWGVWHNTEPITNYRKYFPRFMSEFGLQSFPCLKTVETFTVEEDRNIFSHVMEQHQKNKTANDKILLYIGKMFKYPKNFDSLLYVSQLIQAEGIRYGVEHFRRNRGRCMGSFYWQLNDCWPVASWSSIDYYHRWKALHYHSKKFYAPLLVSIEEDIEHRFASIHITNDQPTDWEGTLHFVDLTLDGNIVASGMREVNVAALSAKKVATMSFDIDKKQAMNRIFRVWLEKEDKRIGESVVSFVSDKHLKLGKPVFETTFETDGDETNLILEADCVAKYVEIDFEHTDLVLSDNYFHLFPGEKKKITIPGKTDLEVLKKELRIRSLVDSYD